MAKKSKDKGKNGELDVARLFRGHGYEARRGQQYCGSNGDADVVGPPGIHIEVKRTEAFRLYDALDQAKRDAKEGLFPIVVHRKNHHEWVVVMTFDDWMELYREWEAGTSGRVDKAT